MPTTTTTMTERRSQVVMTVQVPKKTTLAIHGARLASWKTVLFQSLGRELHALHLQSQERAFMATSHGVNYVASKSETVAVH